MSQKESFIHIISKYFGKKQLKLIDPSVLNKHYLLNFVSVDLLQPFFSIFLLSTFLYFVKFLWLNEHISIKN